MTRTVFHVAGDSHTYRVFPTLVERFIQTIKYECLIESIPLGRQHLDHIVGRWIDYFNKTPFVHGAWSSVTNA